MDVLSLITVSLLVLVSTLASVGGIILSIWSLPVSFSIFSLIVFGVGSLFPLVILFGNALSWFVLLPVIVLFFVSFTGGAFIEYYTTILSGVLLMTSGLLLLSRSFLTEPELVEDTASEENLVLPRSYDYYN